MESGIPDKIFFKIGEVARLTSLRPSILRFWETEFRELQPQKSRTGQRLYTRKELDLVLEIKRLLYSEKLTIKGAKKAFASRGKGKDEREIPDKVNADHLLRIIEEVKDELRNLRDSL